jgi:hypothetical protein
MAKRTATVLGVGLLAVGVLGFAAPGLLGAHLSPAHSAIHLVSGAAALGFGIKGTRATAKAFDLAFGAVYALLGIAGFVLGVPGTSAAGHVAHDAHLLRIVPGVLELGTVDHAIHIAIGAAFVAGALATKRVEPPLPAAPRPA